jgi:hypothetical protein
MSYLNSLLKYLSANKEGIAILLTIFTAICGGVWAVYTRYSDRKKKESSTTQPTVTQVQLGISQADLAAIFEQQRSSIERMLSATPKAEEAKRSELERRLAESQSKLENLQSEYQSYKQRLEQALATLNELRGQLIPTHVDDSIFPKGLKVRSFVKGDHLKLTMSGIPWTGRIFAAGFGLFFTYEMWADLHNRIPLLLFVVFVWFAFFRTPTIKFNFKKRRVTFAGFGGISVTGAYPVLIETKRKADGWEASLKFGSQVFGSFGSYPTAETAVAAVGPFVRALNWEMGLPILMGEGLALARPS